MRETIRRISAVAAIALGIAHLGYGALIFKVLTPDHIWFAGAGVAMICTGLSSWRSPARMEAIVVTVYLVAMASLIPLPQVFLGIAIFSTLVITAKSRHRV